MTMAIICHDGAGFFVVYQFLHLPPSASLADLEEAGQHFCNTPWSSVQADRGAEIHVDRYCFRYTQYKSTILMNQGHVSGVISNAHLLVCAVC